MKRILLLSILFSLAACSPATTAVPSSTPSPIPTSTQTAAPAPTATATATPIPPIDIIHQSLETCPGFEIVCTNPHAFGLTGKGLENWLALRMEMDYQFTTALAEVASTDTAWQAEYTAFFNGEAPPTGPLESLTPEQQLDVIAAIMLAQNKDGFTPFNMPTNLINITIDDPGKLMTYRVNGHLMGFEHSPASFTQAEFDAMITAPGHQVISFGQTVGLPWGQHMNDLGIHASDIIGPVFVPGKAANEAMYLFVYVRDQNNVPHPAFVEIPIAQQTLADGGYITHGGNGGLVAIYPATNLDVTPKVQLNRGPLMTYLVVTPINSSNYATLWKALWQAKENGWGVSFHDASTFKAFMGGIKIVTEITIMSDVGTTMPPLP